MRLPLMLAVLLPFAGSVSAQKVDAPRIGQTVRDTNNARVGVIDRINSDGSVQMVVGSSFVTLSADKLSLADGSVKVAMTKREITRMR